MTRPVLCERWMCPGRAAVHVVFLNPNIPAMWLCPPHAAATVHPTAMEATA